MGRELSVNFVRFNSAYESIECLEPWARAPFPSRLAISAVLYSEEQLEQGSTHDLMWNAAQKQMVLTGWMHNYLRMYWAKKILEWSPSGAVADQRAVQHDRAGRIARYSARSATCHCPVRKKFNSARYIEQIANLEKRGA